MTSNDYKIAFIMLMIKHRKVKLSKADFWSKRKAGTCIKCCLGIYILFTSSNKLNSPSESHHHSTAESGTTYPHRLFWGPYYVLSPLLGLWLHVGEK